MSLFTKVSAAAFATAAIALAPAAMAQPQPVDPTEAEAPDEAVDGPGIGTRIIVYGAAKDPASAGIAAPEDKNVPELPVVYEDEAETAKVSPSAASVLPASPAS
jgi:hypothetical protein